MESKEHNEVNENNINKNRLEEDEKTNVFMNFLKILGWVSMIIGVIAVIYFFKIDLAYGIVLFILSLLLSTVFFDISDIIYAYKNRPKK